MQAQPLGTRLKWIKIAGQGPNALDFHIAFYLGQELAHRPTSECTVFSGDTGFDPLIRHLQSLGHVCRRVQSLKEAFSDPPNAADADHFKRLIMLLKKDKARPPRCKGLTNKVKSWFPNWRRTCNWLSCSVSLMNPTCAILRRGLRTLFRSDLGPPFEVSGSVRPDYASRQAWQPAQDQPATSGAD